MKEYNVKDGDPIYCTLGTQKSSLCVAASHGSCIGGRNVATVKDCKTGVNITAFGMCMRDDPAVPCVPVILNPWLLGNGSVKISGEQALLSTSILSCACGGMIKIDL